VREGHDEFVSSRIEVQGMRNGEKSITRARVMSFEDALWSCPLHARPPRISIVDHSLMS
jgi:hypothetical protein